MRNAWISGIGVQTTCSSEKIDEQTEACTALLTIACTYRLMDLQEDGGHWGPVAPKGVVN